MGQYIGESLEKTLASSRCPKGRLLYYFPKSFRYTQQEYIYVVSFFFIKAEGKEYSPPTYYIALEQQSTCCSNMIGGFTHSTDSSHNGNKGVTPICDYMTISFTGGQSLKHRTISHTLRHPTLCQHGSNKPCPCFGTQEV